MGFHFGGKGRLALTGIKILGIFFIRTVEMIGHSKANPALFSNLINQDVDYFF
ncbi:MAG: hypothetical protein ACKVOU_06475 [Cytophagales bacterium]